ncbi:hypothetical protein BKA81DRAFT_354384 [Phyllosticta paracitricarpa]
MEAGRKALKKSGKPDDGEDGRSDGRVPSVEKLQMQRCFRRWLTPAAQGHGPGTSRRTCFRHSRFKSSTSAAGWSGGGKAEQKG